MSQPWAAPTRRVRLATVWQVRWEPAANRGDRDQRDQTRTWRIPPDGTDARLAARGTYIGLENRLYRVEIHDPGRPEVTTIKWSRDNGSTVAVVRSWTARELRLGRTPERQFDAGDQLEIVDRVTIMNHRPGLFVEVDRVDDDLVRLASTSPDVPTGLVGPLVRRWDGAPRTLSGAEGAAWSELEDGVEVRFEGHEFRTGDYWLIPARTADQDGGAPIAWPTSDGEPELRSPRGVAHYRCPLALLGHDENGWRLMRDLRPAEDPSR